MNYRIEFETDKPIEICAQCPISAIIEDIITCPIGCAEWTDRPEDCPLIEDNLTGTCPTCGGQVRDGYVFCPYCGEFAEGGEAN